MDIKSFTMNLVENAVALSATEMLNLSSLVSTDNKVLRYATSGAVWTLADEGLGYYRSGTNNLLQKNFKGVADDVFYNTVVVAGVSESGIGEKLVSSVNTTLPFDSRVNVAIANGAIKLAAKVGSDMINTVYPNSMLYNVAHVTQALGW